MTDDLTDGEAVPATVSRLTPETLDLVLASLLARRPRAGVAALGDHGGFVPLPAGLPLDGHPEITGVATPFQLVRDEDHPVLVDLWERARLHGSAGGVVHLADDPERKVAMHVVDLRERYGVLLGLVVGYRGASAGPGDDDGERLRPRVCTVTKNDVAVTTGCDSAAVRMLGFAPEELVGRRSLEFLHPDDHQRAIASWMDLTHRPGSSRRVRVRHRLADGGWLWVEMTNHNLLEDPDVRAVVCELVDVSEEMAAQEAVRASEQLLRRLTDALPVGVVQLDPARRVVYANDRTTSVLGRPLAGRSGAGWADLVAVVDPADRDRLERLVGAALEDAVDGDTEVGIAWVGGAARRLEVTVRPLTHEGRVSGALLCLADVTDAAALREELFRKATVDTLTGCLTRAALLPQLDELLAAAAPGRAVCVLFFDLDGFKRINDDHGHAVGDDLLAAIGSTLLAQARPGALVGRLGGDEFLVVDTAAGSPEQARAEAIRLRDAVHLVALLGGRVVTRVSVGWAWTDRPQDAAALVAAADADMYSHKTGRRR